MAQGVPTDEAVVDRFRAAYLYSGNASKAARDCEIPERTGRELAREISKQSDFAEARRDLRAQALEDLVAMRQRIAEEAAERFHDKTGGIDAREFGGQDKTVVVTDKRAEYARVVLDAEKNAHNLAKVDAENRPPGDGPAFVLVEAGEAEPEDKSDE